MTSKAMLLPCVFQMGLVIFALTACNLAHADTERELRCQACFRYCGGVSDTDHCNDTCYTKICTPGDINPLHDIFEPS